MEGRQAPEDPLNLNGLFVIHKKEHLGLGGGGGGGWGGSRGSLSPPGRA